MKSWVLWWLLPATLAATDIVRTFAPNATANFSHLAVDPLTGRVYLGGSNWLFQFGPDLGLEAAVKTGPVRDSVLCFPTDCSGQVLAPYNNVNKLLVLDPAERKLIVCGSVHQGACRRHRLDNISHFEDLIPVPVAANDENSSTFGFIGPARYPGGGSPSRVLYVATTNSRLGPYRDMVPAICSRSLEQGRLFTVVEHSFSSISRVDVSFHLRDYYLVHYIYGFHAGDFVYFASVQRKSHLRALEEWGYVTRLARVCTQDSGYNTYAEVTLQCLGAEVDYNLLQGAVLVPAAAELAADLRLEPGTPVLVGVFAASRDHTYRASARSALCVFPLPEIEQKFTENIHMCYNGSVLTRDMDYIAGSINQCPEPGKAGNVINFCNETVKLNGSVPISAFASAEFPNTTATGVAASVIGHLHNLAVVATDRGEIRKLLLNRASEAEEFETVPVAPGEKILPDLYIDSSQQYLIAATQRTVYKVRLEGCHRYSDCDQCLQAKNPYCGWCSLEKKCTIKSVCQNTTWSFSERSSPRWLSLETKQCIDFRSVKPDRLPYNSIAMVELVINQLPQLPYGAHYLCVFGDSAPITARVTHNGLACMSPLVGARPPLPPGQDHVVVDLAVRSSETETDFIHRPFWYYECSVHRTCKSCVTSTWACSWCAHENLCTNNASLCKRRVIIGESNPQNSLIKGRQHCPSFNLDDDLLVPNGVRREIAIGVKNLLTPMDGFQCVVEIEGAKEVVFAKIQDNVVLCAENIYNYQQEVGELQASLTVLWNGDTFIDKTNVTIYKCHLLGSHGSREDCSLCQTRDRKYHCSWCGGSCSFGDSCVEPVANSCPPPHIDLIHPLSGPVEGGTLVVIEGSNLGSSAEEIRDKITIGGIPCEPVDYSVSVRVVCKTGPSAAGPLLGVITVGNRAGVTRAQEKFFYKAVELSGVFPQLGPQSGGTRLYLNGTHLNVGSSVEVYLDDMPCTVERSLASSSQVTCRTSPSPRPNYAVRRLVMRIDGANLTFPRPFSYTPDPTISSVHPLTTFLNGGRTIWVKGTHLNSIQQPRLIISHQGEVLNETVCQVVHPGAMRCLTPAVQASSPPLAAQLLFLLDGLELRPPAAPLLSYVPDPSLASFTGPGGIKLYKGESLVIEGHRLRQASSEAEVSVTIGTRPCNLTSLTSSQLVCLPPEIQPPGTDETARRTASGLPAVVVRVGPNLRYEVGYLRYEVERAGRELPPWAVAGLAAGGALLMLLSAVTLAALRHKSSQAEREYKRIQLQMDTLENSVRSECKQAFAELQTDMCDLNHELQATGIPLLDHRTYIMKIFFPGVLNNPIIQEFKPINGPQTNYEVAMAQFEQLLYNRNFLLTFVECLERQKTFTIRDKVNVSSLLMIILLAKMEYAKEILKELLLRLVEKYLETKHPQLMLRRAESVVEKLLTNWMALCMYSYIKEHVGKSLFLLFSAIKHQVEKGPVDAITSDARYSLSEERLLREPIDYRVVTVQVIQEEQDEKIVCRVNDCDTISQVKNKILDAVYKNTPFSQRPSIHDVDLEWRHGRGGHLILDDDDLTSKVSGNWQRLNTLAHYGIKDVAVMGLVHRNRNGPMSLPGSASLGTASKTHNVRYWHLVKPVEDHQPKEHSHKAILEIFLTRLLSTKGTIQKFVDDFLTSILTVNEHLPPAIKWLFDLLDEAALRHGISDPEVLHAWKSNSFPLRFWVLLIKNPDYVFDIDKTPTVDSCLSVIAQTFMDACSTAEHRLGKDSPSNKLLFARDLVTYRQRVTRFYQDVAAMPPVSDQHLAAFLGSLSMSHAGEIDSLNALKELYIYVTKYGSQIVDSLEQEPNCQRMARQLSSILIEV